jgi:MoaA/NifB/PqqE/SkfB family radical SAM enzyme
MANLAVSATCNMRCPFCFAEEQMIGMSRSSLPFVSLEAFDDQLAFLARSGIDPVRLIGGEPTLHPRFTELIRRARGHHIVVFTSGLVPERALACLESLPESECTVIVNMNATRRPDGPDAAEMRRRAAVVRRLGARALLGFTISRADFDLDPLLALIRETSAARAIRLGLAQPILGGHNEYLHPKLYPVVGRRIVDAALRAARDGIRLELDCGFVPCMFGDEGLRALERAGADLGWRCNPILDVGVDGTVSHCFPLAGTVDARLTPDLDAPRLRRQFEARTQPYRLAGIYRRCSRCALKRRGECTGGCLAATMRRYRRRTIRVSVPR